MDIKLLEIKTKVNYYWDDIVYINDFDEDSLEIIKRESKIGLKIIILDIFLSQIIMIMVIVL